MTADPTALRELLGRVQMAAGPDRGLDEAIMALFYERRRKYIGVHYVGGGRSMSKVWVDPGTGKWVSTHAFDFTSSIDAAVALIERVLPGWWWIIRTAEESQNFFAQIGTAQGPYDYRKGENCFPARAATPALALCAALLRALLSQHQTEERADG